jgi:hypothetical protein
MRGNLGAVAGPGNCAPGKAPTGPGHINVRRNRMAALDIIVRIDPTDQKSELLV